MSEFKTANEILRYFDARLIGSILLLKAKLLELEDINDIDINVRERQVQKVRAFLNDNGFKETKPYCHHRGYDAYDGSFIFVKEGEKTIHLCVTKELHDVYSIGHLIGEKFKRQTFTDLMQIKKCAESKLIQQATTI